MDSAVSHPSAVIDKSQEMIEYIALAIEVFAVLIIAIAIITATYLHLAQRHRRLERGIAYGLYRERLGYGLLLGLEILVAADVVRTVALEPTIENAAVLGVLVLIRIALSWSLVVEIEHCWPWQIGREKTRADE